MADDDKAIINTLETLPGSLQCHSKTFKDMKRERNLPVYNIVSTHIGNGNMWGGGGRGGWDGGVYLKSKVF